MKKVFLFLTASLFGVAAMAGNTWELDEVSNEIEIAWNQYGGGQTTETNGSYQWQAGNPDVIPDATGNTSWAPALGEKFMVTLTATPNFTSDKVQMFIVDEREEAGYWAALSSATAEMAVTEGEEFTLSKVFNIDNISKVTGDGNEQHPKGSEVEGGLTLPGLIIAAEKPEPLWGAGSVTATDKGKTPLIFSNVTLDILYAPAGNYDNPFELSYTGVADKAEDGYKYQGEIASAVTKAEVGQYVNVAFSGEAISAVKTIMYALVDGAAAASYWTMVTAMTTFATDIEAGSTVNFTFSLPITTATPATTPEFKDVFLAQDPNQEMSKVFDNYSITSRVSATPQYAVAAVKEIAAEDAIVNGVIYAEEIVIFNAAGQVVANASESFEIATLPAGVYFASTSNGAFTFSK